jgi:hypothetical protein
VNCRFVSSATGEEILRRLVLQMGPSQPVCVGLWWGEGSGGWAFSDPYADLTQVRGTGAFSNEFANCPLLRDRGVEGSNPFAPTNFLTFLRKSGQSSLAGHSVFVPNSGSSESIDRCFKSRLSSESFRIPRLPRSRLPPRHHFPQQSPTLRTTRMRRATPQLLQENGYLVLRFLADDLAKELGLSA